MKTQWLEAPEASLSMQVSIVSDAMFISFDTIMVLNPFIFTCSLQQPRNLPSDPAASPPTRVDELRGSRVEDPGPVTLMAQMISGNRLGRLVSWGAGTNK